VGLVLLAACDPVNYTVDQSYGTGGLVTLPGTYFSPPTSRHLFALTTDDSVIVSDDTGGLIKVARNGQLDTAFAANVPPLAAGPAAITVDSSGRVLLLATTGTHILVTRLNPDGSLDTSFGSGGTASIRHKALSNFDLAVDHAGRVDLMFDTAVKDPPYDACAVKRLTANGAVDSTFAGGAAVVVPFVPPPGTTTDMICPRMLVRSDNSISVVESDSGVITLTAGGAVEHGYGNGASTFAGRGEITDAALLPGDAIALGGTEYDGGLGWRMVVGRLLPNGNLDPGFATGGIDVVGFADLISECTTGYTYDEHLAWLSATPSGNLVALGDSCAGLALARWTSTGRDTTLNGDGRLLIHKNTQPDPSAFGAPAIGAVASDGSIVTALEVERLTWLVSAPAPGT
jgi:uncharacterized delta-60 repeat protein